MKERGGIPWGQVKRGESRMARNPKPWDLHSMSPQLLNFPLKQAIASDDSPIHHKKSEYIFQYSHKEEKPPLCEAIAEVGFLPRELVSPRELLWRTRRASKRFEEHMVDRSAEVMGSYGREGRGGGSHNSIEEDSGITSSSHLKNSTSGSKWRGLADVISNRSSRVNPTTPNSISKEGGGSSSSIKSRIKNGLSKKSLRKLRCSSIANMFRMSLSCSKISSCQLRDQSEMPRSLVVINSSVGVTELAIPEDSPPPPPCPIQKEPTMTRSPSITDIDLSMQSFISQEADRRPRDSVRRPREEFYSSAILREMTVARRNRSHSMGSSPDCYYSMPRHGAEIRRKTMRIGSDQEEGSSSSNSMYSFATEGGETSSTPSPPPTRPPPPVPSWNSHSHSHSRRRSQRVPWLSRFVSLSEDGSDEDERSPFSYRSHRLQSSVDNHFQMVVEGFSEHILMQEASSFLGGMGIHDEHRDMRLDVDNMTYEELLDLGESMGNVSTGLNEEKIRLCLKRRRYIASDDHKMEIDTKCSICQEDFEKNTELGVLECRHGYHIPCIKQWLLHKNQCPICKASASSD